MLRASSAGLLCPRHTPRFPSPQCCPSPPRVTVVRMRAVSTHRIYQYHWRRKEEPRGDAVNISEEVKTKSAMTNTNMYHYVRQYRKPVALKSENWHETRRAYGQHGPSRSETTPDQNTDTATSDAHGESHAEGPVDPSVLEAVVANTSSPYVAWDAYERLSSLSCDLSDPLMHRLARLHAEAPVPTHRLFVRLLSILNTIHTRGGTIYLYEWNALIDLSGKGLRKTYVKDYWAALDFFNDMVSQKPPGTSHFRDQVARFERSKTAGPAVKPDIVTYTTLFNIAGRTLHEPTLRHAVSLFDNSGFVPNRITLLARLRYFTRVRSLAGVRETLAVIKERRFDLCLDGINACIWAFGSNGCLGIARRIYRVLRHYLIPEPEEARYSLADTLYSLEQESIVIPPGIIPDAATFIGLIQAYAYHGDIFSSAEIFMDMLTLPRERNGAPHNTILTEEHLPAFRALFLGFYRFGRAYMHEPHLPVGEVDGSAAWSLDSLRAIFEHFLELPDGVAVSERTIFWILESFARLNGRDNTELRVVWEQLVERFGNPRWGGRLERFRREIYTE